MPAVRGGAGHLTGSVVVIDRVVRRSSPNKVIIVCSVCRRVRMTDRVDVFDHAPGILVQHANLLSHTFCPECASTSLGITLEDYLASHGLLITAASTDIQPQLAAV